MKTSSRVEPDQFLPLLERRMTRKQALKLGAAGAAGLWALGSVPRCLGQTPEPNPEGKTMSRAPFSSELWKQWRARGWAREAKHYARLEDGTLRCGLCPNACVLNIDDRGRCGNRVNWNGSLYTLVYGNPCTFHVDPIEKKPLMHFLPSTPVFSLATSGCCFGCLNCQNWDISQRKPEEVKDPSGPELRATPERLRTLSLSDVARLSMFPEDVVALAELARCPSIAYTYSEPIVYYEYVLETARLARQKKIRNVWITCGHIQKDALEELAPHLDAANVNLKSFNEDIYRRLNYGQLQPVLDCLKTLKARGVWFEVTNLVVPTYTDKPDMIRRMCDWLLKNIGPDYPLHFSRFHPAYKLKNLPSTPLEILLQAREIARGAGLRHVYIGNVRELPDAETTWCPKCKRAVIERVAFTVTRNQIRDGKCGFCGDPVAGVWA